MIIGRVSVLPALLGLTLCFGGPAVAATEDGDYAVRGIGSESCGHFIERLQSDERVPAVALSWLLGYSTALNRNVEGAFDLSPLTDPAAILHIVVGLCEQYPDVAVETAASQVLGGLALARLTMDSPVVETRSGDRVANVRHETLRRMQEALIERGHLNGGADGIFGPRTEVALRAFQQEQELEESGVADSATIVRLLVELPASEAQ
jgi:hypothetical protein